ncbi:MAG: transposase [Patescibacteria group bacterium]|jgi:REP element-mobilizing transposase RayT
MFKKNWPIRKFIRLPEYDYSQEGYYFVTICTKYRGQYFGRIQNGNMIQNMIGKIANEYWMQIPRHFNNVCLDKWIIMPDHVHGIIVIKNNESHAVGANNYWPLQDVPWQTQLSQSISSIIRAYKIGVAKWCHENQMNDFQWQRSFHDRIIRTESELNRIRAYIKNNPKNWDCES